MNCLLCHRLLQLLHGYIFKPSEILLQSAVLHLDLPSGPCLPSFNSILKQRYEMSNSFIIVPQIGDISIFNISWFHPLWQSLHKTDTNPNQSNSMPVNSKCFSPSFPLIHVPWEPQAKRTHPREPFVLSVRNTANLICIIIIFHLSG